MAISIVTRWKMLHVHVLLVEVGTSTGVLNRLFLQISVLMPTAPSYNIRTDGKKRYTQL